MPSQTNNTHDPEKTDDTKKSALQVLRTYKLDAARIIKERKESLVSMVLAEESRHKTETDKSTTAIRVRKFHVFLSLALLAGGALLLWAIVAIVQSYQAGDLSRVERVFVHDLLFTETQKTVVITKENQDAIFAPLHAELANTGASAGSVESISYVEEQPIPNIKNGVEQQSITAGTFIASAKIPVSPALEQVLNAPFSIGIYHGKKMSPFLVFKILQGSYQNAFSAMIAWEPAMYGDLSPLFLLPPVSLPPGNAHFTDIVIMNKDVRMLSAMSGESVLYYTFFDKETLVITTSEDALGEIISRLMTPRKISH